MTPYGLKLVWAGWNDDPTIGFSSRAASRWADQLPVGTRMLLYETTGKPKGSKAKGTKSLVGEVEVSGSFDEGATVRAADEQHDAVIPVKVIRARELGDSGAAGAGPQHPGRREVAAHGRILATAERGRISCVG